MPRTILTLTTDFGLADHYVGVMKGVIRGIAPAVEIIDITHDVSPFETNEGAYTIGQAWAWFPKKTIHVVVVDPGVGSARRPILVEAGGHRFIAPDNGVLSMVMEKQKHTVREITAERYFLKPLSETFHGRDVFAPSAAHLAAGVTPARFGKRIDDALRLNLAVQRIGKRQWAGQVLKIDRFGNLITNLSPEEFPEIRNRPFEFGIGMEKITVLAANYASMPIGEPFAIIGSTGLVEVSVNQGNAAKQLGVATGAPVELTLW